MDIIDIYFIFPLFQIFIKESFYFEQTIHSYLQ